MTLNTNGCESKFQGDLLKPEGTRTYALVAPGNLNPERISKLRDLVNSSSFEHFIRNTKGEHHPVGKTSMEIWTWVCSRLGLDKTEQDSTDNLGNFEWDLSENPIVRLAKVKNDYLWFHRTWL